MSLPETQLRSQLGAQLTKNDMKANATEKTGDEPDYEDMAIKGQQKLNEEIATHHVAILKLIGRLEKLGGTQDYKCTILKALEANEGKVTVSRLTQVLPDHDALTEAREALIKDGKITETAIKNRKTLHLGEAA